MAKGRFYIPFLCYLCLNIARASGVYGVKAEVVVDLVYIGLTLVFFALSWGLVKLCERL